MSTFAPINYMNTMDIKQIINQSSTTLVDVRNPHELEEDGAVEGAINIPLPEVPTRVNEFKELSKPIVVFCRSGNRSGQAKDFLVSQGVDDIYNGGSFIEVNEMLEK